jgi:hypothetical protein
MKICIPAVCLLFCVPYTHAQGSPDDLVKHFFATYAKDPAEAIDDVYATNPSTARFKDAVENPMG